MVYSHAELVHLISKYLMDDLRAYGKEKKVENQNVKVVQTMVEKAKGHKLSDCCDTKFM